eukprot:8542090-Pyramimonas_sp.AAC.1
MNVVEAIATRSSTISIRADIGAACELRPGEYNGAPLRRGLTRRQPSAPLTRIQDGGRIGFLRVQMASRHMRRRSTITVTAQAGPPPDSVNVGVPDKLID